LIDNGDVFHRPISASIPSSVILFFYLFASSLSHADSFRLRDGRHINRHEVHLIRRLPARVRIGAKKKGS
jgi:hypothetical protein